MRSGNALSPRRASYLVLTKWVSTHQCAGSRERGERAPKAHDAGRAWTSGKPNDSCWHTLLVSISTPLVRSDSIGPERLRVGPMSRGHCKREAKPVSKLDWSAKTGSSRRAKDWKLGRNIACATFRSD